MSERKRLHTAPIKQRRLIAKLFSSNSCKKPALGCCPGTPSDGSPESNALQPRRDRRRAGVGMLLHEMPTLAEHSLSTTAVSPLGREVKGLSAAP